MRSAIATTVALVAFGAVAIMRTVAVLTDSALIIGAAVGVVLGSAALIGVVVATRISAVYEAMIRRDRAVAVAASHELRTPITALRLSLEDLTMWKETAPAVADELNRSIAELDRLSKAVTELLDRREAGKRLEAIDLAEVAASVVERWRPQVASSYVIQLNAISPLLADVPRAQVCEVMDVLLAHATARSRDGIAVDVVQLGSTLRVRVSFDDPRQLPTGVIHGTATADDTDGDLKLAEAGEMAEAMGGYLGVEDVPGTCLVLIVPAADASMAA